jgi:Zn-dependent M28 family amino/carboxypeptidase
MDFTNDPVTSSPGANDNASSVAAVLELLALGKGPRIERIFAWCFL